MLSKPNNRLAMRGIILSSLLTLLSSCANSAAIESLISADPDLKSEKKAELADDRKSVRTVKTSGRSNTESQSNSIDTTAETAELAKETPQANNRERNRATEDENVVQAPAVKKSERESTSESENPILNFPDTFPVYPQAELETVELSEDEKSGTMVWKTGDNRQAIADYYLAELTADDWDVIKPFTINPQRRIARAIAVKDDLRVELSLQQPQGKDKDATRQGTQLSVVYHPLDAEIPKSSISRAEKVSTPKQSAESKLATDEDSQSSESRDRAEKNSDRQNEPSTENQNRAVSKPAKQENAAIAKLKSTANNNSLRLADTDFSDLDEVPPQLQQPIESVAALSILTPYTGQANVELSRFAPNEIITRAEYARWLIDANNRYFADNPGKKIYVPAKTSQPAFKDVKAGHPDFAAIQSLAEAGLIPSRLTEDSTNLLFKPNAPLTREDLVTWKVPLDTRQSLPKASIEAIEESWGFRDTAKINSNAVQALYADFQNGDRANVRRMFGYTTLFQPKKPVTRAEAAASLWYFGFQGDGITAKELLESEAETKS